MASTAGTKLGRYEIRSLIGVGGMGEVYRASDPKIGRVEAIKFFPRISGPRRHRDRLVQGQVG